MRFVKSQSKSSISRNFQPNLQAHVDIGSTRDARPYPSGPKFLSLHAVFGENWSNCWLAPLWKILDPSLSSINRKPEGFIQSCKSHISFGGKFR